MKFRCQARQGQRFVEVLFDVAAHCLDGFRRLVAADGFGTAAQAGTIASFFRLVGLAKEGYILASRAARWARGPAIYAGRRHGKNELAVLVGVAPEDRLPPPAVIAVFRAGVSQCHFRCCSEVEYRIACHNVESLRPIPAVDYPVLAVKVKFVDDAGAPDAEGPEQKSSWVLLRGSQFIHGHSLQ